jgi:hypothetical protein
MLIRVCLNIGLPVLPLAIVALLARLLNWRRRFIDLLGDGQLYFLSISLCGVFAFDALEQGKLHRDWFLVALFGTILLSCLYTASIFILHSDFEAMKIEEFRLANSRKLAWCSIWATLFTLAIIFYIRWNLNLF